MEQETEVNDQQGAETLVSIASRELNPVNRLLDELGGRSIPGETCSDRLIASLWVVPPLQVSLLSLLLPFLSLLLHLIYSLIPVSPFSPSSSPSSSSSSISFTVSSCFVWPSLVAQTVKNPPAKQEMKVGFLGGEDPLEKGMATHSSIVAWRIPWTEKPGGHQSMRLQRVRHD